MNIFRNPSALDHAPSVFTMLDPRLTIGTVDDPKYASAMAGEGRKRGATKQARTLNDAQKALLWQSVTSRAFHPASARLILELSFHAGLRVGEIASLDLDAVTDAQGRRTNYITITSDKSKNGRQRTIPMHPGVRDAFDQFFARYPGIPFFALAAKRTLRPMPVQTLTNWFHKQYKLAGLVGCSSHSGRRTFITELARRVGDFQTSLRDVQQLAGHASLETTALYIEPSQMASELVGSL